MREEIIQSVSEGTGEVKTGVDQLLELLKKTDKIALEEAAKKLGVSVDVVQSWVDFLVEERVIGIEYKFTKPYIYLNVLQQETPPQTVEEEEVTLQKLRAEFFKKAREKNIPEQNIPSLWRNHLLQELEAKKEYFFKEARERALNPEPLWNAYKEKVLAG